MYFNITLITFIILLAIISISKTLEILKGLNKSDHELEIMRAKLYAEREIQTSLKSRIKLLDGLNTILFSRISFIVNELIDMQKDIISNKIN